MLDYEFEFLPSGERQIVSFGKFGGELWLVPVLFYENVQDDETSAEGLGWYGMWDFTSEWDEDWFARNDINPAEAAFLKSVSGLIVHERDDGIIVTEWFGAEEEDRFRTVWATIQKDMDEASKFTCDYVSCPGHYYDSCDEQECEYEECEQCHAHIYTENTYWVSDLGKFCSVECMNEAEELEAGNV